jgi:hypothetical protein
MTTSRPARVWAEVTGGDALGRGHQPALSWWLPEGSAVQHAYQVRTDDGFDTGRVESATQSFVRVPVFDRSRRFAAAQVRVWTDRGESEWGDAVALESGLLGEADWTARWIGVAEESRGAPGSRGAWWVRTSFEVAPFGRSRSVPGSCPLLTCCRCWRTMDISILRMSCCGRTRRRRG